MIDWEKLNKLNLTAEEKLIVIYVALNPGTNIESMEPVLNVGNLIPYIENLKSKILQETDGKYFLKESIMFFSEEVKNMIANVMGEIKQNIAIFLQTIQQKNAISRRNTILQNGIQQKNAISDIADSFQPSLELIPQDAVAGGEIPQENTISFSNENANIYYINKTINKRKNKQIKDKENNKRINKEEKTNTNKTNNKRINKEEEININKEEEINTNKTSNKREYSDEFEEFWKFYPRKIDKYLAYIRWNQRLKEGIIPENLILACKNYARAKIGEDIKFILHPATFLGPHRRWETYLEDFYEGRAERKYSEEELEEKLK
jgi:hypothetical protein